MGLAGLSLPSISFPWFKTPFGHWDWCRAARRLWEWFKLPQHNGEFRFKYKDWELAQILGVGRRCIQEALYFLEHVVKVIKRYKDYGPNGGRVIEITIPLAGPKPKARPATKRPATGTAAKSTSIPNVGESRPANPAQLAAAAAQIAEAEAGPAEAIDPELDSATKAFLDGSRARREAEAARKAKAKATPKLETPVIRRPDAPGMAAQILLEQKRAQAAAASTMPRPALE